MSDSTSPPSNLDQLNFVTPSLVPADKAASSITTAADAPAAVAPQLRPSRPPPPTPESQNEPEEASIAPAATAPAPGARARPPVPTKSLLHPSTSVLPNHNALNADVLTPLRAHYLKKFLVNHQFMDELAIISSPALGTDGIASLGAPFRPPMEQVSDAPEGQMRPKPLPDLPYLRFMFRQFVLTFPFLSAAPSSFWPLKVQPTLSQFLSLSLSGTSIPFLDDDPTLQQDAAKRRRIFDKLEKHLTLLLGSAIKIEGGEEVVRIGQEDLRKLEEDAKRRIGARAKIAVFEKGFSIDVIGVRGVTEKSRVGRSKSHEEFLVRTTRTGMPDAFVWRRYGDFKRLSEELRLRHPEEEIRSPPPKDRTTVAANPTQATPQSTRAYLYSFIPGTGSSTPTRRPTDSDPLSPASQPGLNRMGTADSAIDGNFMSPNLSREKNRLTLRSFLRSLLTSPPIASSPVLRSFLLSQLVQLSPSEEVDARRREDADRVREEGRKRFKREAERRVEDLRGSIRQMREEMIARGGVKGVFEEVRKTENVQDLPEGYRKVIEYGRISLASTIFQTFVASDDASTTLLQLKRLHSLMPYFVLKGILKISNPMAMIRGVLDLFLARPFGGQSLAQRMFSTSLNEDIRELQEQIDIISEKIGDPDFCEKIKQFVAAPAEIQQIFKTDADAEGIDIIAVILRSPDAPTLGRPQMMRVIRAHRAYAQYKNDRDELDDSDDDDGPDQEEAWLFVDLNHVMRLYALMREKEQMVALIFESATADLLKDIITIFYSPLAQVYKAANIADSLGDLQNFINDLIRTCDAVEELSGEDPHATVQTFIDLCQRHEQAFYTFVHRVHSKGSNLFSSLMSWIELFLDFVRDGLPPLANGGPRRIDLDFLLPHSGPDRVAMIKEIDAIAIYHYKLKVAHEGKTRRKFLREGGIRGPNGELVDPDDDEQALVDSIVDGFSFGNTMRGDAAEIADEESSSGEEDDDDTAPSLSEEDSEGDDNFVTPEGSDDGHHGTPVRPPSHASLEGKLQPWAAADEAPSGSGSKQAAAKKKKKHRVPQLHRHGKGKEVGEQQQQDDQPRRLPPKDADGLYSKKEIGRHAKRKGKVQIQPPVVRLLPTLLPIFVEMTRPLLAVASLDGPGPNPPRPA